MFHLKGEHVSSGVSGSDSSLQLSSFCTFRGAAFSHLFSHHYSRFFLFFLIWVFSKRPWRHWSHEKLAAAHWRLTGSQDAKWWLLLQSDQIGWFYSDTETPPGAGPGHLSIVCGHFLNETVILFLSPSNSSKWAPIRRKAQAPQNHGGLSRTLLVLQFGSMRSSSMTPCVNQFRADFHLFTRTNHPIYFLKYRERQECCSKKTIPLRIGTWWQMKLNCKMFYEAHSSTTLRGVEECCWRVVHVRTVRR